MYEKLVLEIGDRLTNVKSEIESFCDENGLKYPTIIAVSKMKSLDHIRAAYDNGQIDFGENYAQELRNKCDNLSDIDIKWHFIGHLQQRHAKFVSSVSTYIHSIDSERILNRLKRVKCTSVLFLQVNLSSELSKFGAKFEELPTLLDHALSLNLDVRGLMAIGSLSWDLEEQLHAFRRVSQFREELGLDYFSAGMSGDWKSALLAGSTHLRIGTAIFGSRK